MSEENDSNWEVYKPVRFWTEDDEWWIEAGPSTAVELGEMR